MSADFNLLAAIKATLDIERLKADPAQTDPEAWRVLLQELSDLAIADGRIRRRLTPDQVEKKWLGCPPATEEQITAAERRLGIALPPSYRAFLKVSNGWHFPNIFVERIAGSEQIDYTRTADPQLIETWANIEGDPSLPLDKTLLLSMPARDEQAASLMLNPAATMSHEMEAWFFSTWNPGADAQPSFWHLMACQVINWRTMAAMAT